MDFSSTTVVVTPNIAINHLNFALEASGGKEGQREETGYRERNIGKQSRLISAGIRTQQGERVLD